MFPQVPICSRKIGLSCFYSQLVQVKQAPVKQQVQKALDADVELDDFLSDLTPEI